MNWIKINVIHTFGHFVRWKRALWSEKSFDVRLSLRILIRVIFDDRLDVNFKHCKMRENFRKYGIIIIKEKCHFQVCSILFATVYDSTLIHHMFKTNKPPQNTFTSCCNGQRCLIFCFLTSFVAVYIVFFVFVCYLWINIALLLTPGSGKVVFCFVSCNLMCIIGVRKYHMQIMSLMTNYLCKKNKLSVLLHILMVIIIYNLNACIYLFIFLLSFDLGKKI